MVFFTLQAAHCKKNIDTFFLWVGGSHTWIPLGVQVLDVNAHFIETAESWRKSRSKFGLFFCFLFFVFLCRSCRDARRVLTQHRQPMHVKSRGRRRNDWFGKWHTLSTWRQLVLLVSAGIGITSLEPFFLFFFVFFFYMSAYLTCDVMRGGQLWEVHHK